VTPPPQAARDIVVRRAREHNLKDIDVRIPRDRLVVITGLSGSGKSSLAFDTIYAEGQRRYVESLSAYARQFLEQMGKPDVESIEGLSPAISIEQKTVSKNPRSTVGTVTEIYDHLRLLYARIGQPHCTACGKPIARQTVQQITDRVLALSEGTRVQVLAPVVRGRKGEFRRELEQFQKQGFVRARIDGVTCDLADEHRLAKQKAHDIDVVVDRLAVKPAVRGRLSESVETALRLADGMVRIDVGPGEREELLSERNACVDCGISFGEIEPRSFSFNSPHGACPACSGLGTRRELDPERIVPDPDRSLARGASARRGILYGIHGETIAFEFDRGGRTETVKRGWDGVIGELERRRRSSGDTGAHDDFGRYTSARPCAECDGSRLRAEARSVRVGGLGIHEFSRLGVAQAGAFLDALELDPTRSAIADRILRELRERLRLLTELGLDYLSLDRGSKTLSGGEGQRIRLATQVGSSLMGVLYILDEPSIGMHARDTARLLVTLERLRDLGNSVIVVEHDEATVRAADWVIDMGPGAGIHGGRVVAQGPVEAIERNPASLTGQYLTRAAHHRLPRAQPEGRAPGAAARSVHRRDRRLGLGQVDAGERHALPRARPASPRSQGVAGPLRAHRRSRAHRQGRGREPGADWAHAAQQPRNIHRGARRDPQAVRPGARGARARIRPRPLLLQREGRPL
jgi:excinuclease ABC subunit A